jgi:hypothetical protein
MTLGALRVERFDELLERELLVDLGLQRRCLHAGEQLRESRIAGQIGA